ncbi:RNA methyltransferase, partial [human gut metagenome]
RQSCDVLASIPISSDVESLNASVAASIALYEASRVRGSASES